MGLSCHWVYGWRSSAINYVEFCSDSRFKDISNITFGNYIFLCRSFFSASLQLLIWYLSDLYSVSLNWSHLDWTRCSFVIFFRAPDPEDVGKPNRGQNGAGLHEEMPRESHQHLGLGDDFTYWCCTNLTPQRTDTIGADGPGMVLLISDECLGLFIRWETLLREKEKMRVVYLSIGKALYALIVVCCLWTYSRVLEPYIVCDRNICLSRDLSACRGLAFIFITWPGPRL